MVREVNKAHAGFSAKLHDTFHLAPSALGDISDGLKSGAGVPPVATGNWGCGAFGGDVQIKFALQWIAASLAGRGVVYHPFSSQEVNERAIARFTSAFSGKTVADVWGALRRFAGSGRASEIGLFDFVAA